MNQWRRVIPSILIDSASYLVIAYFNHVGKDWMTINMISGKALNEIRRVLDTTR